MRKALLIIILLTIIILVSLLIGFDLQKSRSSNYSGQGYSKTILSSETTTTNYIKDCVIDPLLPDISPTDCIISHNYYTLCYNEYNEQANWVAYKLTSGMLTNTTKRKDNFRTDPLVSTGSANPADYTKSGYDKGHLCPAADMSFSSEAMSETFYMSNMSPQVPQFNRGIWKILEEKVKGWTTKNSELFITTGPVFTQTVTRIGKNKVAVPQYFFKVILDYKPPGIKGIGFIMKNQGSDKKISAFAVTIDSVEKFTGIDFYTALPDAEERVIESQCDIEIW